MKTSKQTLKAVITGWVLLLSHQLLLAQDEVSSKVVTTTTSTKTWFAEPWAWALGAGVLILLIVIFTRRGSSGPDRVEQVTVTKSSSTNI